MSTNHHTALTGTVQITKASVNDPLGQLDAALSDILNADLTMKTDAVDRAAVLKDGVVTTAKILDDNVTLDKLANITRGSIIVGGAADAPTLLDANDSGKILVGDGTDLKSVAVSGDATLAANGALTIANDAVTTAKILSANVTAAKLATDAVETAKIKDANVTMGKLASDVQAAIAAAGSGSVNLLWDEVFQHADDFGNWNGKSWWDGNSASLQLVTSSTAPYGSKLLRVTVDEKGKGTYLEELGLQPGDVISVGMMCKAASGTYRCKVIFRTTGPGASAISTDVGDYYTFGNDTYALVINDITIPTTANWISIVPDVSGSFGTLDIYGMWLNRGAVAAAYPSPSPFTATYLRLKEWETSSQRLMVRNIDATNFAVYQPQHDDQSWMQWLFTKLTDANPTVTNNWTYYGANACSDNAGTGAYGAVTFDIGYAIYYTPAGESGETCGNHHRYDNFTSVHFYDEAGDTVDPTASGAAFSVKKLRIEQKGTLRHPDTSTTDHATISRFIEITTEHIYEHQRLTWLTDGNTVGYWNTGQLLASSATRAWLHNYGSAPRLAADPSITIDDITKAYTWYSSRKFAFQVECPTVDAVQIRTTTLKLYPRTINVDTTRNIGDTDHAEWYWRVLWDKEFEQRI